MRRPSPYIFGIWDPVLPDTLRRFFAAHNPLGFCLFAPALENTLQIQNLIADLKDAVQRDDPSILIDCEGGRVWRLPQALYPRPPAAQVLGNLWLTEGAEEAKAKARAHAQAIGRTLKSLQITVNCAPLIDLYVPGAHGIIGDRAFAQDPEIVGALGQHVVLGLQEAGVIPVIKHLPGHGASGADSHTDLPVITLTRSDLEAHFLPFQMNTQSPLGTPWGMTAHILYTALDPHQLATFSETIIHNTIRKEIGFEGFLVSDDLAMDAVAHLSPADRVTQALKAGCDAVLYCKGGLEVYTQAVAGGHVLSDRSHERLEASRLRTCARLEVV